MITTRRAIANAFSALLASALVVIAIAKGLGATIAQMQGVAWALAIPPAIATLLSLVVTFIPTLAGSPRRAASVGAVAGVLTPICVLALIFLRDAIRGGSGGLFWNPFPFYALVATPPLSILGAALGFVLGQMCDRIRRPQSRDTI